MPAPLLELRHVSVMRGERLAIQDLSLTIDSGEHVALIGPNGCGKSTLLKTITRECYPLLQPGASMRIMGQERWDIFGLRRHLGIVSQDLMATCTREMTGLELVLSGFFSSIGLWPHQEVTPAMHDRAHAELALLEADYLANRPVNEMSTGEAKRTLLARALVSDPASLLFDEPTTALDFRAQYELSTIMRQQAQAGRGLILVTHHLEDVIPEVTRVILLREGRILADGPKEDILTAAHLAELWQLPVEVHAHNGYYHLHHA